MLGHLIFSPPIVTSTGDDQYTQDVAVIDVDTSKIDSAHLLGNVINLGTKYDRQDLIDMMYPDAMNTHNTTSNILMIASCILRVFTDKEMRNPTALDQHGEPCITVLKRGRTTDLTVGRANNVFSHRRHYVEDKGSGVSKEWAILPFGKNSGSFSEGGGSGSVVVHGAGRIGGILTSGTGSTDSTDITFVTPISFILRVIHSHKPLAKAYLWPTPCDFAPTPKVGGMIGTFIDGAKTWVSTILGSKSK